MKLQVVQTVITYWMHTQGDIMLEWIPSKCACCPGLEPASQWRGPLSLMIPVYSLSRWHCLQLFNNKTQTENTLCYNVVLKLHWTAVFVVIRILQKRTEESGSSLCPTTAKCTSWTVNCAPLACSWKLSEQSESEPTRADAWLQQDVMMQWWQWCDEKLCTQTFSEQVDGSSEGTEWDQKQISQHSALCRRWNLAAERGVGDVLSRCRGTLIPVFLLTQNWLCFSLRAAHEQLDIYKRKLDTMDDYERQVCLLREEMTYLSTEKAMLQER